MEPIDQFTGEFAFLSNFSPHSIHANGWLWPTVEHAFQAAKTLDLVERDSIRQAATPGRAKRLGRKVTLRPDWEPRKVQFMEQLVRAKFEQHPDIRARLLATGDRDLIEGNQWGDRFWGVSGGAGRNELGRILMRVRADYASASVE